MIPKDKQVFDLYGRRNIINEIEKDTFDYCVIRDKEFEKGIIWALVVKEIPFKTIFHGAGVRTIKRVG